MFMVVVESDCCDCGLPCIHEACIHFKVIRFYCDQCGCEDDLYYWNGEQLCSSCILEELEKVEYEEI